MKTNKTSRHNKFDNNNRYALYYNLVYRFEILYLYERRIQI